jgi:dihydrofolate synthase/folylpolyglutamate synthase
VTSIGIDHTEYLGDTREEIAAEKAGIFKHGVPAIIGERDPSIRSLLSRLASEHQASRILDVSVDAMPDEVNVGADGTTFTVTVGADRGWVRTGLAGAHQACNASLALLMLNAAGGRFATSLSEARAALPSVRLPGRFQRVGPYIFDVAHNPDGAAVFAATVEAVGPPGPRAALLCVLADKDWRGVMTALSRVVDVFVLTEAPTAPASRAWDLESVGAFAHDQGWRSISEPDFDRALERATEVASTVLITGSFHTVGDAMARLNVDPVDG